MGSSNSASNRMARVRQRDTDPEMALRRELYQRNLRYKVNYTVLERPRRVADVAFPGLRVAVFVDGCFWHGCPEHATWPKTNSQFWLTKIEANRARDADTNARLLAAGWHVLRVWEHEAPVDAATRIKDLIRTLKAS
jgi:DNA mismatch endonuclease (patch repair protein)